MAVQRCPTCHREYDQGYLKCPFDGAALIDADAADSHDPMLGRQLADTYQLVRKLGEGGMGTVYEARHTRLDSSFAIKLLHPALSINEEMLARFHREARSASQLKHPGIIDVFDVNKTPDNMHFIVQEFLEGQPLSDLLEERPVLDLPRGVSILTQICDAMAAAHEQEIVHRDLKPENVFLIERDGKPDFVKVLDFGIAKMQESGTKLTQASTAMGTPDYISPEQALSAGSADFHSDIYSLGVMIYRVFTGRLPYEIENPLFALDAVRTRDPVLPTARNPDISPDVEAVIMQAMARDPARRHASMLELKAALEQLLAGSIPATLTGAQAGGLCPATSPTLAPVAGDGALTGPGAPVPPTRSDPTAPETPAAAPGPASGPTPVAAGQVKPTTVAEQARAKSNMTAVIAIISLVVLGGGAAGAYFLYVADHPGGARSAADAAGTAAAIAPAAPPDARAVSAEEPDAAPTMRNRETKFVQGGDFTMGRRGGPKNEGPPHACEVASFRLDRTEVTRGEFALFLRAAAGVPLGKKKRWSGFEVTDGDRDLPVTEVTWEEADAFCRGVPGRRLPTEREWEYAARGPRHDALYPTGKTPPGPGVANHRRKKEMASDLRAAGKPVDGLSDMIGNVSEWVSDRYGYYSMKCKKRTNLRPLRVLRGGGYDDIKTVRLTATARMAQDPKTFRWKSVGFRCARDSAPKR